MVRDYTLHHYVPAAARAAALTADDAASARQLAGWKQWVRSRWPGVGVNEVGPPVDSHVDEAIEIEASVQLNGLGISDVTVSVVVGEVDHEGDLDNGTFTEMHHVGDDPADGSRSLFRCTVTCDHPGSMGFAVRVVPNHPGLSRWAELGLIATGA